ncbi:DUF6542 domain-containing protein [Jatrophihabitans sp. DSM 45814]
MPEPPGESDYSGTRGHRYESVEPRQSPSSTRSSRSASQRSARERLTPERGLPGWAALLVLLVIAGVGGAVDQISGASIQGIFSWALILGSLVAILIVRRSEMFPVVIAPPLVYFIASAVKLYVSSNGLKDRAALTDAAANWLVYGFPAIAGATAVVLVIAGIRMIARR